MKWTACAARFALGASLLALALPGIAVAEEKDDPAPTEAEAIADPATAELDGSLLSSANRVYTQTDFTQYNPRTALDMVQRIPGFSVCGSDSRHHRHAGRDERADQPIPERGRTGR